MNMSETSDLDQSKRRFYFGTNDINRPWEKCTGAEELSNITGIPLVKIPLQRMYKCTIDIWTIYELGEL